MDVLEIITKYWLEFLLGIIGTGLLANYKKIKEKVQEYKAMKQQQKEDMFKKGLLEAVDPIIKQYSAKSDTADLGIQDTLGMMQEHLSSLNEQVVLITHGVLNMQAQVFKSECKELLSKDEPITTLEYEKCMKNHALYNQLGGNSDGDTLFELVTEKYKHQL